MKDVRSKLNTTRSHSIKKKQPVSMISCFFLLMSPREHGRVQTVETSKRSCLPLKWLPRLANWLDLSTMKSSHNYSPVFSTRRPNGICDWMRLCPPEAARLFDFVTSIAGSSDVFTSVNQPPLTSTNKERPKQHESAVFVPLAAAVSLSLHTFQLGD